ncbi:MAG: tRNA pseudouridine(55) synthase TruB [Nitrospirae bacterium]|nr:tRNA pseudouridine(55) synthase TruB [Nitrospirota bacterium]
MDGILLVDKPAGWTSHDAVNFIRRALNEKRVGHTGTLDPDATGLLVVLVGKATRLAKYFGGDTKGYRAAMRLGSETDTQDASGTVIKECPVPEITREEILAAFRDFTGEITQIPPMYSAVKKDGRALYKSAREGVEVAREPRAATVHSLELLGVEGGLITFDTVCGKGTYIRTLCVDLGVRLGTCAHMETLRRTSVSRYSVDGAVDISGKPDRDVLAAGVIGMGDILTEMPSVVVTGTGEKWIRDGRRPRTEDIASLPAGLAAGDSIRVLDSEGELLAVAEATGESDGPIRPRVVVV